MGPRVAKVVAEAAAAELDLQMSQETFELTVQRLQEELNRLRIENKISEQQYEQAVQMAPYLIQEHSSGSCSDSTKTSACSWKTNTHVRVLRHA